MVTDIQVEQDLVTSEMAASIIGITLNNFRQKVHKKEIHAVTRMGRRTLYSRQDAEALRDVRAIKVRPVG